MTKISQSRTALSLLLQMTFSALAPLIIASPTFAQSTFTDVQGNWSQSCISQLAQQGIISGGAMRFC
ncbi:hypothetical protein [uncultured Nostoc sp.]|uniref:hypothetical protein n=1 Tax=uncultured Nostoc sp. TaxID=340711 RepID=UPI0035CA2742